MFLTPTHPNQMVFSFVPHVEVVIQQEAWIFQEEKKSKAVQNRFKSGLQFLERDIDLSLPLFRRSEDDETEDEHILDLDSLDSVEEINHSAEADEDIPTQVDEKVSDYLSWQDQDYIHRLLLRGNFRILKSKGRPKEKEDILNWIFSDEIPGSVIRNMDGTVTKVRLPFTFETCCAFCGCDPDSLRDLILATLHKAQSETPKKQICLL